VDFRLNWLFGRSKRIKDFFADAVRVYVLKGEEDARCVALAAAKLATKKQRKSMIQSLAEMRSKVMQNYPNKLARKSLADRLVLLKEDIEAKDWDVSNVMEEKEKLSKMNEEYLSCLNRIDASVFKRKYPNLF